MSRTTVNELDRRIIEELRAAGCRLPAGRRALGHIAAACKAVAATPAGGWPETRERLRDLAELGEYERTGDAVRPYRWQAYVDGRTANEAVRRAGGYVHPQED